MEIRDDFVSRTIKTQKLFSFNPGQCYYVNFEVTKKNQKNGQDPNIKIINNVCKNTNSVLMKITEVRFGNRVIYIEDSYTFKLHNQTNQNHGKNSSTPTNSSEGSTNNNSLHTSNHESMVKKKKLIFKKKAAPVQNSNSKEKKQKRNTKNIAKNFCKAFISYLQQHREQSIFQYVKELVEKKKFNNKVIEKMAIDKRINLFFKKFLETKAMEWISYSKIHDKQIHIEAISLYLKLIEEALTNVEIGQERGNSNDRSVYHSDSSYDGSDEDNGAGSSVQK